MKLNTKLIIVSLLYFAEGFPFGIIEQMLPVCYREHKWSLTDIGYLSILTLPYALKFLWAPAVDFLGARRHWIAVAQLFMGAVIIALVPLDPSSPRFLLWGLLASLAILSATQDIAIDAYSIEMLNPSEMGIANGVRLVAYRVGLLMSGGLFIALGGWIGWQPVYFAAAAVLFVCGAASLTLPRVEVQRPPFSISTLAEPAWELLRRPGTVNVALFILLYKLGDLAAGPMIRPFWLDQGLSLQQIGLITGTIGLVASGIGGLAGGFFIMRFGIFTGLWFLGIWQAVSNLTYAFVAAYPSGKEAIYAASFIESFCAGLGSAAFLAFLMSICRKEFSATQYAILSALFRVTGIIAGGLSGHATDFMGYADYFAFTFLLSLPAFAFLGSARWWVPPETDGTSGRKDADTAPPPRQLYRVS